MLRASRLLRRFWQVGRRQLWHKTEVAACDLRMRLDGRGSAEATPKLSGRAPYEPAYRRNVRVNEHRH